MGSWLHSLLLMPSRVAAIAGVTFTQLVRMRLFLILAVFGIGFMGLQFLPYREHLGVEFGGVQQLQLIKDIAMGCMQLFGLVFCVGATALLIPRDTEDRILYTILCKPVPRFGYLLGKLLGVLLLLLVMLLLMDGLMSLLLHLQEGVLTRDLRESLLARNFSEADIAPYIGQVADAGNTLDTQRGIAAMFLGFGVLSSLTLLFSCFTSGTIVSMVFGLGTYFVGMFQTQFFHALHTAQGVSGTGGGMRLAAQVFSVLVPDFSLFAVADAASSGATLAWGLLGGLLLIAAAYMLFHLLIATWLFSRKEF